MAKTNGQFWVAVADDGRLRAEALVAGMLGLTHKPDQSNTFLRLVDKAAARHAPAPL
jgi:hypothetical protein